jgi:hypothetical protein
MSTAALSTESVPALSESERLLYTFTAPSRTMADLRRNASWWIPWLLVSIMSIAFTYTLEKRIGWGQAMETQIQSNPKLSAQLDKMSPEQRAQADKLRAVAGRISGYAAPIILLGGMALGAGILLGIFNFGFGAKLTFTEMMGVTAYSTLPGIINTALMILVMFLVAPDAFNIEHPIATNPGYFIPSTMPFLKTVLSAFDVFTLWQLVLIAIGVSQLSKVKRVPAFATMFSLLFVVKLVIAAFSSL